jgi:hypothetical protein
VKPERPRWLLTQNSDLRRIGVWNWPLPAHMVTLQTGEHFNVCPNAGACGRVCYAKFGTYQFSNVKARHLANLEYVLFDGDEWEQQMLAEVNHRKFRPTKVPTGDFLYVNRYNDEWMFNWLCVGGRAVRIHDGGDFFDQEYLDRWVRIAQQTPHVLFYAYTKEVAMLKATVLPENFRVLYSLGGKQDHLIDRDVDRHADVFPTWQALVEAGYWDQEQSDLIAVTAPTTRIGIVANNIRVANKRFDGRTLSDM